MNVLEKYDIEFYLNDGPNDWHALMLCVNHDLGIVLFAATDAELLELSIEKWKFFESVWDQPNAGFWDGGTQTCALCSRFFHREGAELNHCYGCPISDRVGQPYCRNTPYTDQYNPNYPAMMRVFLESLREDQDDPYTV